MKEQDPAGFPEPEIDFDALQLDLPIAELRSEDPGAGVTYPSSHTVLTNFLTSLDASQPARLAGSMLRDFGTLSAILSASWWRLRRSVGRRLATAIGASRALLEGVLLEGVVEGPVLANRAEVIKFLQVHLGSLRRERLLALYVDHEGRLLRIERVADGALREAPVYVPRIIHSALDVGASAIVLVHNHPSGDPQASEADIRITRRLARAAAELDMALLDHLIISKHAWGRVPL